MANWIIALLVGIGAGTWVYTKLMRSTGNNKSSSLIAAAIAAVLLFILLYILLDHFLNS